MSYDIRINQTIVVASLPTLATQTVHSNFIVWSETTDTCMQTGRIEKLCKHV